MSPGTGHRLAVMSDHGITHGSDLIECFGGLARLSQAVKDLKQKYPNSVYVNAGDFYQVESMTMVELEISDSDNFGKFMLTHVP